MSETPPADSTEAAVLPHSRAGLTLAFGMLSPAALLYIGTLELSLSGIVLLGEPDEPYPLYLRVLALLPFWIIVALTFFFAFRNQRKTKGAKASVIVGCTLALIAAAGGWYLTQIALFPQNQLWPAPF